MIGNDIVDLVLAQKESNWQRKGFLDKIFTNKEQILILNTKNPEVMVWNLWSRKEAAYKIYNRQTGIRGYFPLQLECFFQTQNLGSVTILGNTYYTQTEIHQEYIYTVAVVEKKLFKILRVLKPKETIYKTNGIPNRIDLDTQNSKLVSISRHGRFVRKITMY